MINKERMNREVYCEGCKVYSFTDECDPKCSTCKRNLVNVHYSSLSGQKITGVPEFDERRLLEGLK